jgi:hypothetical protein
MYNEKTLKIPILWRCEDMHHYLYIVGSQFPVSVALALARGRAGSLYMRLAQMKHI